MKTHALRTLAAFAIGGCLVLPASAASLTLEDAVQTTITARVLALDPKTREVTLKGPLGNELSFTVDPRVKRLDEIMVGDDVTAEYYASIAGEVRAPTEEEKKQSLVEVIGTAKAPEGSAPGMAAVRVIKAIVTVKAVDVSTHSLVVVGPKGRALTVRLDATDTLAELRPGDTIVATYTESIAVSMEKAATVSE